MRKAIEVLFKSSTLSSILGLINDAPVSRTRWIQRRVRLDDRARVLRDVCDENDDVVDEDHRIRAGQDAACQKVKYFSRASRTIPSCHCRKLFTFAATTELRPDCTRAADAR